MFCQFKSPRPGPLPARAGRGSWWCQVARKALGKAQEQVVPYFIVPVEGAGKHHHRDFFVQIQPQVGGISRNHTVFKNKRHPAIIKVVDHPTQGHVFLRRFKLNAMRCGQCGSSGWWSSPRLAWAKIIKSWTVEYRPPVLRMMSPMSQAAVGVLRQGNFG